MIDMTNKKINKWLVLEQAGKNSKNEILWLCECECGTQKIINGCDLRRNRTKSCGCDKNDDFLNKNFGKWKVLSKAKSRNGKRYFLCECECGNQKEVVAQSLKEGKSLSCGKCNNKSIGEIKIENILKNNNIPYETEKTFVDFVFSSSQIHPRFDFYVNNQYIIEFDGIQHFIANGGWNTEEKVKENKEKDKIKNQYCFDNNIPIIRIPYTILNNISLQDLIPETSHYLLKVENI